MAPYYPLHVSDLLEYERMFDPFFSGKLERSGLILVVVLATLGLGCTCILAFAPERFSSLSFGQLVLATLGISAPGMLYLLVLANVVINISNPNKGDPDPQNEKNYADTFVTAAFMNAIALGGPALFKLAFDIGTIRGAIWFAIILYLLPLGLVILGVAISIFRAR